MRNQRQGQQKPCVFPGCNGTMELMAEIIRETPPLGVSFEPPTETVKYWECQSDPDHHESQP